MSKRKQSSNYVERNPSFINYEQLNVSFLINKLKTFGIELDKTKLESLRQGAFSIDEIVRHLENEYVPESKLESIESNWIFPSILELSKRWFNEDALPFNNFLDRMFEVDKLSIEGKYRASCDLALETWNQLTLDMDEYGIKTLDEIIERTGAYSEISGFIGDSFLDMWNLGLHDIEYQKRRVEFAHGILDRLTEQNEKTQSLLENVRISLTESLFELGEDEKANALYQTWMEEDPEWGYGWISWSFCIRRSKKSGKEKFEKAEELLRKGLAVENVREKANIVHKLAELLEEVDRKEEANVYWKRLSQFEPDDEYKPFPTEYCSGSRKVREFQSFFKNLSLLNNPDGMDIDSPKIGRKDPCPCNSGKKYKRCCGK